MGTLRDLTKEGPFDRLTVIERAGTTKSGQAMWLCQCDCGAETVVLGSNLTRGLTRSCGCYHKERAAEANFVDRTGTMVGRLRVIEQAGWYITPSDGKRSATWLCQCACGNWVTVLGGNLTAENTQSCGCLGNTRNTVYRTAKARFAVYRENAEKDGRWFELDLETFDWITSQPCHYCGGMPGSHNGIDRVDSALGYQYGNVVSCCWPCNRAKGTLSPDEFERCDARGLAERRRAAYTVSISELEKAQ